MEDYLKEIGEIGLIARLKRVSDNMLYSIRDLYKIKGFDIEPNWHLVLLQLKKYKTRTMTEISDSLGLSQPAVVKMINKMKKNGYIEIISDKVDSRKKQISLSEKAKEKLPELERVWKGGKATIEGLLLKNKTFVKQLENIENQLSEKSFKDRVLSNLNKK
ncbi:MAG: MarR family transcriptional regulator [Cyclobacteriaceae bacterium]